MRFELNFSHGQEKNSAQKEYCQQEKTNPEKVSSQESSFGSKDRLLLIHNMGAKCSYCTLWADGINGILSQLENEVSVVLVSPDLPDLQRRFAL